MRQLLGGFSGFRLAIVVFNVLAAVLVPAAVTQAANGSLYMPQATDPHGVLWLNGSLGGHLWLADVVYGFCRMDVDPASGAVKISTVANACAHTGQKSSQATLDPVQNPDGTSYVYSCDWAAQSQGCYRMSFSPATETMVKTELLAPGRFPGNIKPFATALGPRDHKLYVSSDLNPNIYRYTVPNGPAIGNQTVEQVATSNDGKRIRAITFACWDPMRAQQGLPSCAQMAASGDPAPDLVIAQITTIDVLLNAETCQTAPGGCTALKTPVHVTSPMGLYTQPGNPDVIYVTDSPATTSQIIRYTISGNVQDSFSNFGVLPDGTLAQYAFMFSVTIAPDGTMYAGDDPSAGATSFNGRIWRVAAGAPADAVGSPGTPAIPPAPPTQTTGVEYGTGVTMPNDGVWMGSHLWISDGVDGFCRVDVDPVSRLAALNTTTCSVATTKPGQPAFDPASGFVYVPDATSKSVGVIRLQFDASGTMCGAPETVCNPVTLAPGMGLEDQKADAAAVDPTSGTLYLGFQARNATAPTQIARILNPAGPVGTQSVEFVARTTRQRPVYGLLFVGADLWVSDNSGIETLPNVKTCQPGGCATVLVLNVAGPRGFATDGKRYLYTAAPLIPPPGTTVPAGSINTVVERYDVTTGDIVPFSSTAVLPDGTSGPYWIVDSLTVAPNGNLFIADDPNVLGLPTQQGRIFEIGSGSQAALVSITARPGNPTSNPLPSFSFSSAQSGVTFQCSLVASTAADAYAPCTSPAGFGPLADGTYTFKVVATDASGAQGTPASYTFAVDTVAPVVSITAAPSNPTNKVTPTFSFTSTKTATFQCSLTTASTPAYSTCGSGTGTAASMTYAAQADGPYTFSVRATDAAGNVSQPVTAGLTIDTVAPVVTASPPGGSYVSTQSVSLVSSEAGTIHYTLDGSTPDLASPVYSAPLAISGTTTLAYMAVDLAGNVSPVVSNVYSIGSVSITTAPTSLTNNNQPTFAFASAAPATQFECSWSAGAPAYTACTSPMAYPAQADGTYTFSVNGYDATGVSVGTASTRVTIDTTPPAVPMLTQNPANPSASSGATFAFSSVAGATFTCALAPATATPAFAPCTSPATYGPLADGSYTFRLTATDAAGNVSAANVYSFVVAAVAPPTVTAPVHTLKGLTTAQAGTSATTTSSGPLTAGTVGVPVVVTWTGTACGSGALNCNIDHYVLQQSVNGAAFNSVTLPTPNATSVTMNLLPSPVNKGTATTYRFQVQAVDSSGQLSPFAAGPTFTVTDVDNTFSSSFAGGWSGVNLAGAFGGSVQESTTSGATANPASAQTATSFAWVSTLGPDRGRAQVKVDGQLVGTVDLYAPQQIAAQVAWTINGLAPGLSHQVQIVSTGTRNAAATASKVDYDAILALK